MKTFNASKNYATGEILIQFDEPVTREEVIAYAKEAYGVTAMDVGPLFQPDTYKGLANPGSCRIKTPVLK